MANGFSKKFKRTIKHVGRTTGSLLEQAVQLSATNVGNQLASISRSPNQPFDEIRALLLNAVRTGLVTTGQQLLDRGLDRVAEARGVMPVRRTMPLAEEPEVQLDTQLVADEDADEAEQSK